MATLLDLYTLLLRPLFFRLPAETAQGAAHLALGRRAFWRAMSPAFRTGDARLKAELCGIPLSNPVGVAAGFDKNCRMLPSLAALGFGYLMAGTVTQTSRPGNPKPRLLRDVKGQSLINAMGFPNEGLEAAAHRLEQARGAVGDTPICVSVSGVTSEQITRCHDRLEPLVDAVELNISSPNTAGLRVFQEPAALREVIARVSESRAKPLMVKLPPYPSSASQEPAEEQARENALALVRACLSEGVDAVTVANSRPVADHRLSTGAGGLSGKAVFADTLRMVADVKAEVGDRLAVNACGGIFTGDAAWQALKAGASTVQLYTGLVYRGPGVAKRINRELLAVMEREGTDSLASIPVSPGRP